MSRLPHVETRYRWVMPLFWTVVIVGNIVIVYDQWSSTPQGQATLDAWHARYLARWDKIKNCGGCAKRKAKLAEMVNRVHWDAERIVEGEDVPTVPEP